MTQPGSDAREVCVVCSLPATRGDDESGRKYWCGKHGPFYDYVTIRKDLAQRILAALYAAGMGAMADELRAVIGK